jgi:AraC family transcriptional regulator
MAQLIPSLNAHLHLKAKMTADSWQVGWRSLLLRAYIDPAEVEELKNPPTADHLIVLVTSGSTDIESYHKGRWYAAHYKPGSLAMNASGQENTLRWRGKKTHSTLQLHIPRPTIEAKARELSNKDAGFPKLPNGLLVRDPLVSQVVWGLAEAMAEGAPDLYAEITAELLATHLLVRHCKFSQPGIRPHEDMRLRRVDMLMRGSLGKPLSLASMATEAGLSRFHLLRMFKQAYGETPFQRLTRFRMEEARRRLRQGRESVTEIAFACGYDNPGHFASAFRRVVGVTPRAYRQARR